MTRIALPALLVIAALLAAALAAEIALDQSGGTLAVPSRPAAAPVAVGLSTKDGSDQSPAWVATALARPLFNTDRRPAAAKTASAAPTALPRLAGIVMTPTGRQAIFAASAGGKPLTVVEGAKMGLYTITRIEDGAVSVIGPDGASQIRLSFATGPEASATNADTGAAGATIGTFPPPGSSPTGLDLIRSLPQLLIPATPRK